MPSRTLAERERSPELTARSAHVSFLQLVTALCSDADKADALPRDRNAFKMTAGDGARDSDVRGSTDAEDVATGAASFASCSDANASTKR